METTVLTGSEKQISYANDLRSQQFSRIANVRDALAAELARDIPGATVVVTGPNGEQRAMPLRPFRAEAAELITANYSELESWLASRVEAKSVLNMLTNSYDRKSLGAEWDDLNAMGDDRRRNLNALANSMSATWNIAREHSYGN